MRYSRRTVLTLPLITAAGSNDEDLDRLFKDAADTIISYRPEGATSLGIDTDRYGYSVAHSRLSDRSHAGCGEYIDALGRLLDRCQRIDPESATGLRRASLLSLRYWLATEVATRDFPAWADLDGVSPYAVSQLTGAYLAIPDFLESQHPVVNRQDVEAYLERLHGFARAIDQDTERLRTDAALGVLAPDFALGKAVTQLNRLRAAQANTKSNLAGSLARRARDAKIASDWMESGQRILEHEVIPAIDRQLAALAVLLPTATHEAGVWRLPKGPEFYAVALRQSVTTDLTPSEIHKRGLDLQAQLSAGIDVNLRKLGLTAGSVGARLRHLYDDPKLRYANTPAGKQRLLHAAEHLITTINARLPKVFRTLPKAAVIVKPVPSFLEEGAPGAYFNEASIDGSRPGIYYINLRDPAETPPWGLPTLTFHESDPGHHLQTSIEYESTDLPLIQKILMGAGFTAYIEGWALYAEQLAVELGMYEHDPLGLIGYQHAALFRAVRLVVDTGLHHLRWSREQALRYYTDALGDNQRAAETEIDRYCVWPGQACGYMVGKLTFLELRSKAIAALGAKFDIRDFHYAVLLPGAVPLDVLKDEVASYIAKVSP